MDIFFVILSNRLVSYPKQKWKMLETFYHKIIYNDLYTDLPLVDCDDKYYIEFDHNDTQGPFKIRIYADEIIYNDGGQGSPPEVKLYQITSRSNFNKHNKRKVYITYFKN